jgi:hypothetical protein
VAVDLIVDAVGDRTLIEFVEHAHGLEAVIVRSGRVSIASITPDVDELAELQAKLVFALQRLAAADRSRASSARTLFEAIASDLDRRLFAPARLAEDDGLVIVPTGRLHHLPWGALATCQRRGTVVAPSAHLWYRAETATSTPGPAVIVAGPDLPEAVAEVTDVARRWPGSAQLLGGDATVEAVRGALRSSSVAHLCTHGVFRTDNPQFSSLELVDGPLMIHDLEGIGSMPALVILSACSLGSVDIKPGDDVLGFPAAMLARGVQTLIAAQLPVEDAATRALMLQFHDGLRIGDRPATALRNAANAIREVSAQHAAAAASVVCFGSG